MPLPPWPAYWLHANGVRRFNIAERLDGVVIALELAGNDPAFVALLSRSPSPTRVVLEDARSVTDAIAQCDERWPVSTWVHEKAAPLAELVDAGADAGGPDLRLPLGGTDGGGLVMKIAPELGRHMFTLQTPAIAYATFQYVGLEIVWRGARGLVTVDQTSVAGDINLLTAPDVHVVTDGERYEIRMFRQYPVIQANNIAYVSLAVAIDDPAGGDGLLTASAIVRRIADTAAGWTSAAGWNP